MTSSLKSLQLVKDKVPDGTVLPQATATLEAFERIATRNHRLQIVRVAAKVTKIAGMILTVTGTAPVLGKILVSSGTLTAFVAWSWDTVFPLEKPHLT